MTFHQCGKYEGAGEDDGGKKSGKKSKKSRGWKRGVNNVLGDLVNDPALSRDSIIKGNAARLKSKAKREIKRRNAIALSGGTTRLAEYR